MRVYAIAKELGVTSAEVLAVAGAEGLMATSGLDAEQEAAVRAAFASAGTTVQSAQATQAAADGANDSGDPGEGVGEEEAGSPGSEAAGAVAPAAGEPAADDEPITSERWYEFVGASLRAAGATYRAGDRVPMEVVKALPMHIRRKLVLHRG